MTKTTKMISTVLFSAACFAPAAVIGYANGGFDAPPAPYEAPVAAPEAAPEAPRTEVLAEVVIVAEAPRKATKAPRKPVVRCTTRATEIHAGTVQICDKARTGNGKPGLWAPVPKPRLLASRDVPSPSGLLR